jgi:hypothetical protein
VFRTAGETVTTQENIRDWIELDEVDRGFHLVTEECIALVKFLFNSISSTYINTFSFFLSSYCLLGLYFD